MSPHGKNVRVAVAPRSVQGPLAAIGYAGTDALQPEPTYEWLDPVKATFTTVTGEAYFPELAARARLEFDGRDPREMPTDAGELRRATRVQPYTQDEMANLDRRLTTNMITDEVFHDSSHSDARKGKVLLPLPTEITANPFTYRLPEELKQAKRRTTEGVHRDHMDECAEVGLMEKMAPALEKNVRRAQLALNENMKYTRKLREGTRGLLHDLLQKTTAGEVEATLTTWLGGVAVAEMKEGKQCDNTAGSNAEVASLVCAGNSTPVQNGFVLVEHLRNNVISGWARATHKLIPSLPQTGPAQPVFKAVPEDDVIMAAAASKAHAEIAKVGDGENARRWKQPHSAGRHQGYHGRKSQFSQYNQPKRQKSAESGSDSWSQGRGDGQQSRDHGQSRGRGRGRGHGRGRGRGRGRGT